MINSKDFTFRLETMMDYYGDNASAFAEKIGVQRSSISHILSGRNKPSLDFVIKIISQYPEVDLYWLLNGKGEFPKTDNKPADSTKPVLEKTIVNPSITLPVPNDDAIERIVIFYKDGTFRNYITK